MSTLIVKTELGGDILHDESLYSDVALSHSLPHNAKDVCDIVKECRSQGIRITVCGGLTGLNGAAVPTKCHSMNTRHLSSLRYDSQHHMVKLGSGTTFSALEQFVARESKRKWEFPVTPTEKTATIGGALSFGSTGLRSFLFGPVASFVEEIEYCDAFGSLQVLHRGEANFDQFLGMEGMLGIITQVTVKLIQKKAAVWSILFFFPEDEGATHFADMVAQEECVETLEYIDKASFDVCELYRQDLAILEGIPAMPAGQQSSILVEIHAESEDDVVGVAERLMDEASSFGGDPDLAWAMAGDEIEKLRNLRHAISECINMKIAQHHTENSLIRKVGIDIQWEGKERAWILNFYRRILRTTGLNYCIFGHIGTFSPYVNILPQTQEAYDKANTIVDSLYREAQKQGGKIFSELGVGKLHRTLFCMYAPIDDVVKRDKIKNHFDPDGLFNPANMLETHCKSEKGKYKQ